MSGPWDDEMRALVLAAEQDEPDGDLASLDPAQDDEASEAADQSDDVGAAASGITSHVFSRRGNRAFSQSSFKPPHTTEAVWTRVAFYTADTGRLVLSDWRNKGSSNQHRTLLQTWYFDHPRARKALVLWWMNGNTWRRWAE